MTIAFVRAIIIYYAVVLAVRLMGKRQIGELKPHELVVTILVSQIATIPMEDNSMPLLNSLVPIFAIVAIEIIVSVVSMKSLTVRNLLQGRPVFIIRDGKIDQKQLKRLRYTVDDLIDSLRQKDVFDISTVEYAVVETNGSISVVEKAEFCPVSAGDLNIKPEQKGIPIVLVMDGKVVEEYFSGYKSSLDEVNAELKKRNIAMQNVLVMCRDRLDNYIIVEKEEGV